MVANRPERVSRYRAKIQAARRQRENMSERMCRERNALRNINVSAVFPVTIDIADFCILTPRFVKGINYGFTPASGVLIGGIPERYNRIKKIENVERIKTSFTDLLCIVWIGKYLREHYTLRAFRKASCSRCYCYKVRFYERTPLV